VAVPPENVGCTERAGFPSTSLLGSPRTENRPTHLDLPQPSSETINEKIIPGSSWHKRGHRGLLHQAGRRLLFLQETTIDFGRSMRGRRWVSAKGLSQWKAADDHHLPWDTQPKKALTFRLFIAVEGFRSRGNPGRTAKGFGVRGRAARSGFWSPWEGTGRLGVSSEGARERRTAVGVLHGVGADCDPARLAGSQKTAGLLDCL
jgi:hypothetical protein